MLEPELGRGERNPSRLRRIERAGQARFHVAECTGARAGIAHDHEGRVLLLPALADVRTARLFAHGMQPMPADDLARLDIALRERGLHSDPGRFFRCRQVGAVDLLGVAGAIEAVEHDDHGYGPSVPYLRTAASGGKKNGGGDAGQCAPSMVKPTLSVT